MQKSKQKSTIELLQSKIKNLEDRLDMKNPSRWGLKRENCEIQLASKVDSNLMLQYQFPKFSGFQELGKIPTLTGPQPDSRYDV